jgi:hypothetical protein
LAVALYPGNAQNLARPHLQIDSMKPPGHAQILYFEDRFPGRDFRFFEPEEHLTAHHHLGELSFARLRRGRLTHDLAASQHRDAIGDVEHFVELVRDEHDRLAVGLEPPQVVEQVLGLRRSQHRGGLVEDQDIDASVQRLEDLDALLLSHRQVLDLAARVELEPIVLSL